VYYLCYVATISFHILLSAIIRESSTIQLCTVS
jgi:hypothetical protein